MLDNYSKEIISILKENYIDVGDKIKIIRDGDTFIGRVMPRISFGDENSLIIKLENGYNTGIKINSKTEISKIEKYQEPKKEKLDIKLNTNKKSISILSTGGTIVSKVSYATGGVKGTMTPEEVFLNIPELKEIVNLKETNILFNVSSENITPNHWKIIAEKTAESLKTSDGVVIMHGTDTLHYTAAALSFMLKNLSKPVVLLGSQRSSDRGSADGYLNLICGAYTAISDISEVVVVMHGTINDDYCLINRGTKTRKMHTSRRDAFRPINNLPIGKIWKNGKIEIINKDYKKRSNNEIILDTKMENKVGIIKIFPGSQPEILNYYLKQNYKGIIIEATGLGHVPLGEINWLPKIKELIKKNVTIAFASQTVYGRLHPFVYEPARNLWKAGVIYLEDMMSEVAYVKLSYVLGHTQNKEEIKKMMLTNLSGEITEKSDVDTFLY